MRLSVQIVTGTLTHTQLISDTAAFFFFYNLQRREALVFAEMRFL